MKQIFHSRFVALVLLAALVAPSSFLAFAPRAHAQTIPVTEVGPNLFTNIKTTVESTFSAVKNAITSVATVATAASDLALQIDKYVLEPIAFITSGQLLKAITASVLKFVTGQANGTGIPQFVQNLRGHLLSISDNQAVAFFAEIGSNSNSPFAGTLASSLRANYLHSTSAGGFWAANQCTLQQFSTDINRYISGDFTQGGYGAWFALTTQPQNNPYLAYYRDQGELNSRIENAVSAGLDELNWGQGFLSWCSPSPSAAETAAATKAPAGSKIENVVVTPEVNCTDKNGNPGTIQTPGSVIKDELQQVLGIDVNKLLNIGNISPEINSILGSIGTVMQTINLASSILGGSSGGGLANVTSSTSGRPSALDQYTNSSGYLGVTTGQVAQDSSTIGSNPAQASARVDQYAAAWNTINTVATAAATAVNSLAASCNAATSQAQSALTTEINPVLAQAATAATTVATARAFIQKVQAEASATTDSAVTAYTNDLKTLQTMAPSASDLAEAQQQAQVSNTAQATPDGSLSVSGSSYIDEMNLIATNAAALQNSCGGSHP